MLALLLAATLTVTPEFCQQHGMEYPNPPEGRAPNTCLLVLTDCDGAHTKRLYLPPEIVLRLEARFRWMKRGGNCRGEPMPPLDGTGS